MYSTRVVCHAFRGRTTSSVRSVGHMPDIPDAVFPEVRKGLCLDVGSK